MATDRYLDEVSQTLLIVAGSGRSGTTWVLDAIADANNLQTVFEPLHSVVGENAAKYAGMYVPPASKSEELKCFMDDALSGSLSNLWTDYRTLPDRLRPQLRTFISVHKAVELYGHYKNLWKNYKKQTRLKSSSGVAVKFIRANLMLNWLAANYEAKILFIVRHPCAVIESKMRLDASAKQAGLSHGASDWDPQPLLKRYLDDPLLQQDFIYRYFDKFKKDSYTEAEAHALIWCLENVPVINDSQDNNICVACYENLVVSEEEEWRRIVGFLDLKNVPGSEKLKDPSQQASEDFRQHDSKITKLSRWSERMGADTLAEINEILKIFNVELYTVHNSMPIDSALEL